MKKISKTILVLGMMSILLLGLFISCDDDIVTVEKVSAITITAKVGSEVVEGTVKNDVSVKVTLATETDSANIYYTLDGTTPSADSKKFNGEVIVAASALDEPEEGGTVVLKAIAIKSGYENSGVAELKVKFSSVAADALAEALQTENEVTLTSNVVINGVIEIPEGATLNTNEHKLIGTEDGHLKVYGTLYAASFVDIDQYWIGGGTATFYGGSNWQVLDEDHTEYGKTAFIGSVDDRDVMIIDEGHVTVEYHKGLAGGHGIKLTIPSDSEATIKSYHLSNPAHTNKMNNDYRIASKDHYLVEGKLNVNYRVNVYGFLEVAPGGQINISQTKSNEREYLYLFGSSTEFDGFFTSPEGTVIGIGENCRIRVMSHIGDKKGTLNGVEVIKDKVYEWAEDNEEWVINN